MNGGTWEATCPECGWSFAGSLLLVQDKLTEHHQTTKRQVAEKLPDSATPEKIRALCHYPALVQRIGR